MERLILSTFLLLQCSSLSAQMERDSGMPRSFEFGLPDGDEIGKCLIIAFPFILVGFLIANYVWWSKTEAERRNTTSIGNNFGCFGIVLIGIGFVCLFPLLTWIEYIFVSIYSLAFAIFVIAIIIYGLISLFKKK